MLFKNSIQLYEKKCLDINFHIFFLDLCHHEDFSSVGNLERVGQEGVRGDMMVEFILISLTRPSFAIPLFTFVIRDKGK